MLKLNRFMLALHLFCYWWFLASGFEPAHGKIAHFAGTFACAWSIYNGIMRHYQSKDGEGIAWAVIGSLVFVGFSARWLVAVA